jgi:integrase
MVAGRRVTVKAGTSYEQAARRLRSLKSETPPKLRLTVRDAALQWLERYVPVHRAERDQKLATRRVEMYLVPHLGFRLLHKVGKDDLRAYRLELERRGHLSVQSVRHILADVRCMLRWCEDSDLIERALIPRRFLPRVQERPPDRLTDEEVERILRVPEPYVFVVRLALGTGLRWGELTRATAGDIQDGWLIVHHTKSGRLRRGPTCSGAPSRAAAAGRAPGAVSRWDRVQPAGKEAQRGGAVPSPPAAPHLRLSVARIGARARGAAADPRARHDHDDAALWTAE